MAQVYSNFVLYNDTPQRHYRQIAAKRDDDGSCYVQTWEGTVLSVEPFAHENSDAELVFYASVDEAVAASQSDHDKSLREGWFDYDPHEP